jgi:autotransporter-associated beta strand protein
VVSGAGGISKSGNATLILSGNNTYSGGTTISAGTLEIASSGRLNGGSYSSAIANSGTLIYSGTNNQTLSGIISGTGALTQNGTGTLTISGANTYTGTTTVNVGTLAFGASQTLGAIAGSGNISLSSFALTTNSSSNSTFSGTISGTGALTKAGSGTLTLSGNNTYTGTTTVSAGTLSITGSYAGAAAGTVFAANGGSMIFDMNTGNATFYGNNYSSAPGIGIASTGQVTLQSGTLNILTQTGAGTSYGSLNLGINAANSNGTLTINGGTMNVEGRILMGANTPAGSRGTLTINGGNLNLGTAGNYSSTGNFENGVLYFGAYTSTVNLNGGTLSMFAITNANPSAGSSFNFNGGTLRAVANNSNFLNLGTNMTATVMSGGAIIDDGGFAITISKALLDGGGGGGLTKNGTGTLTISGANTYTGTTTVNAGTLALGANQNMGAITGSGNISLSTFTLTTNSSSNTTFSGVIAGTGALTKNGSSRLLLAGNNTYTGATTVNAGTLALGSSTGVPTASTLSVNGGVFDLNGNNFTTSALSNGVAGAIITDNSAVAGTSAFTINYTTQTVLAPAINDGANGRLVAVNIILGSGSPQITLTGNNTFSGGLTLLNGTNTNGTRLLYTANGTGTAGNITSSQLGRGNLTIGQVNGDSAQFWLSTSNVTVLNPIVFNTAATVGSVAGAIRLDASNVVLAGKLTANLTDINIGDGSVGGSSATLTGQLTGTNGLWIRNGYTTNALSVTLANTSGSLNNYQGNTTVDSRHTLILGAANQIPSGSGYGSLTLNGTLNLGGYNTAVNNITGTGIVEAGGGTPVFTVGATDLSGNYTGIFRNSSGTLSLVKAGNGTITLSGNNTYSGTTTISAGTLEIGSTGRLGGGNYTAAISNNGTFLYSGSNNQTLSGIISGTGDITKNGTGLLTLSGNNTYSGTTTVNVGTLAFGANQTLGAIAGAGNITISSFNLTTNSSSNTTFSGVISGTGALTKNGNGTLTLSGANTYTGNTIVNAGTLALGANDVLSNSSNLTITGGTFDISSYSDTVNIITMTNGNLTGTTGVLTGSAYNITGGTVTANLGGGTLYIGNGTTSISVIGSNVALNVNGGSAVAALTNNVTAMSVTLLNGGSITGAYSLNSTGGLSASSGTVASNLIGSGGVTDERHRQHAHPHGQQHLHRQHDDHRRNDLGERRRRQSPAPPASTWPTARRSSTPAALVRSTVRSR